MRLDLTTPPTIAVTDACTRRSHPSHWMVPMKIVLILFIIVRWTGTADATYDLNIGQMEYVADHLTKKECRQLIEALGADQLLIEYLPTGSNIPDVSCIRLLLHWDRTDGRGRSFTELGIRLKQIGRYDIADYLSTHVYGEKIAGVHNSILSPNLVGDDPHTELLSAKDQSGVAVEPRKEDPEHGMAVVYLVAIILGVVAIVGLVGYLVLSRINWNCKTPECCLFLKQNVPIYLCGVTPELPRELRERRELLLAEERLSGNPYVV